MMSETSRKIKAKLRNPVPVPVHKDGRQWSHTGSCHHSLMIDEKLAALAMFDLDETLLKLNSTELIMESIQYAKACRDAGQQLVVMSNQYGITKGQTTHDEIRSRFKVLDDVLGGRVSYLYAPDKDQYRKPMTGMFDIICMVCRPILEKSFYCGDAIGRISDFAVSDLYFAQNCGVKCLVPPNGQKEQLIQDVVSKFKLYTNLTPLDNWIISGDHLLEVPELDAGPLLVMMVGPQGSGKSYLSQMLKKNFDQFVVLNRDTIGSTSKMDSEFRRLVKARKSIILDNTNYDHDKRKSYLEADGYQVRIYYFDLPKELCFHMCHMRLQLGGPRIPPVAIHTYYKRLQPPTDIEGKIIHINGIISSIKLIPQFYYHYDLKER